MVTSGTLLTVLSSIPWGQVVDNAPKIADGATRLWGAVKGMRGQPAEAGVETDAGAGQDDLSGAAERPDAGARAEALAVRLAGQVATLEASVAELQTQLQASSGLIKDLAEQNAQLVQRISSHEQRLVQLRRLVLGGAVVTLALLAALVAWVAMR